MQKSFVFLMVMCIFSPGILLAQELPADYQAKSGLEKQTLLWNEIEKSKYDVLPVKSVSGLDMLNLFKVSYLTKTISHESDEMPVMRKKIIHTYGTVAKITFIPVENSVSYTGLFSSECSGLLRASVVNLDPKNLKPGIALKLFVNGHPSVNTVGLYSIDGQGKNYNFFAHSFSNIIPPSKSALMKSVLGFFTKAAKQFNPDGSAMKVTLKAFTEINPDGTAVKTSVTPEQIFFTPATGVMQNTEDNRDFRVKLSELNPGVKLFDVYAANTEAQGGMVLIGEIRLESKFIASKYGDEKLFFQHTVK